MDNLPQLKKACALLLSGHCPVYVTPLFLLNAFTVAHGQQHNRGTGVYPCNPAGDSERILPVIYNDNFFTLLRGEETTMIMELQNAGTRGIKPALVAEGFNR